MESKEVIARIGKILKDNTAITEDEYIAKKKRGGGRYVYFVRILLTMTYNNYITILKKQNMIIIYQKRF